MAHASDCPLMPPYVQANSCTWAQLMNYHALASAVCILATRDMWMRMQAERGTEWAGTDVRISDTAAWLVVLVGPSRAF